jgi:hypothetical protein
MPILHYPLSYDASNMLMCLLKEETCLALSLKLKSTFLLLLHFLLQHGRHKILIYDLPLLYPLPFKDADAIRCVCCVSAKVLLAG